MKREIFVTSASQEALARGRAYAYKPSIEISNKEEKQKIKEVLGYFLISLGILLLKR